MKKIPEDFHALYDVGFRALTASLRLETAGHSWLAAEVPDVVVQYDEATQLIFSGNRCCACKG